MDNSKKMNIAIIDTGYVKLDVHNPLGTAVGGSETWMIQISKAFSELASVDVFMNYQYDEQFSYSDKLCFLPLKNVFKILYKKKYDFVILNRAFEYNGTNYIKFIKDNKIAKHIYLQVHDLSLFIHGKYIERSVDISQYGLTDPILTIVTLNEWHKRNLILQYPVLSDVIISPNGINSELFNVKRPEKRDNRVLWSSAPDRGLDILIKDIYPLVKAKIPDFGIDIAGYIDYKDEIPKDRDVNILGRLDKETLYKEQSKHKVWFYPCTFAETFCITAIENIKNGCKIVSPLSDGLGAILQPYTDKLKMQYNFKSQNTYQKAIEEAANKLIEILEDKNNDKEIYDGLHKIIAERYNWDFSVKQYVDHYSKLTERRNKKILFLSMSCNDPYFKTLLAVTRDTWAKPLIQGKYENCTWFGYTACDKQHPVPMIDFDEHIVYVNTQDDFYHTYEKTQMAYNMLVESGIEFDYVVRTNTSVFVNLQKTIAKINALPNDVALGGQVGYYHCYRDGHREFQFNIIVGLFFGMSKMMFDGCMSATNQYDTIPTSDDVIISKRLYEVFGKVHCITPNGNCTTVFPRYKAYLPDDKVTLEDYIKNGVPATFVDDPNCVNNYCVIQVRPLYKDTKERAEKGHEFEHFYELNDALC